MPHRISWLVVVALLATSNSAAAAEKLPEITWADTLDQAKIEKLASVYAAYAKENPKDFDVRVRTAIFGFYAWRLEKKDNKRRIHFAKLAYIMGKEAAELRPDRAEGWHWMGAGLGMIGLTRGVLNSLQVIPQGKAAFEKSIALDPNYFDASAIAQMARVYTMVPGFPISIGDKKKALEFILEAKKRAPTASLWTLYLADVLWALGENEEALAALSKFDAQKPTLEHEYFTYHTSKPKKDELLALIKSGASRDPFHDVLSDLQPGLVD